MNATGDQITDTGYFTGSIRQSQRMNDEVNGNACLHLKRECARKRRLTWQKDASAAIMTWRYLPTRWKCTFTVKRSLSYTSRSCLVTSQRVGWLGDSLTTCQQRLRRSSRHRQIANVVSQNFKQASSSEHRKSAYPDPSQVDYLQDCKPY
jgi:hypothetical protein